MDSAVLFFDVSVCFVKTCKNVVKVLVKVGEFLLGVFVADVVDAVLATGFVILNISPFLYRL